MKVQTKNANNDPLISILIPTRNRYFLLRMAIETILKQEMQDYEVIIQDNNSSDATSQIANEFRNNKIKYFRSDVDLNVTDNWNLALRNSHGRFVLMLGDDDALVPKALQELASMVSKHESFDAAYLGAYLYAAQGTIGDNSRGFCRSYSNREIYQNQKQSFELDSKLRSKLLNQSLEFVVSYDYNPQFWLISRDFLIRNNLFTNFYKSLYPDYFTSIFLMKFAKSIVVNPKHITIIGLTTSSHGYLHFKMEQEQALTYLGADPLSIKNSKSLKYRFSPNLMTLQWGIVLAQLQLQYQLKVNWSKYYLIQLRDVCTYLLSNSSIDRLNLTTMKFHHRAIFWILIKLNKIRIMRKINFSLFSIFNNIVVSHPRVDMPEISCNLESIYTVSINATC